MLNGNNVAHLIVNNLGGITTLTQNLILYKGLDDLPQELFLLNVIGNKNNSANDVINSEIKPFHLNFDPKQNWYHCFRKIANSLSLNSGILVSNDQYDLIMLLQFNIPRKVVQLVHDDYNLSLSLKFHHCIDRFISHNKFIYTSLCNLLPTRQNDIHFLNYGIPLFKNYNAKLNSTLNLLFLGRHDIQKGIYDLFEIEEILQKNNVLVNWTILGKGPETESIKLQWNTKNNVSFHLAKDNNEVLNIASGQDVLVFPTRFEGSPVAMLEAMSVGCVPVVTSLSGGINETIKDGINGFLCGLGSIHEFAEKIILLANDRKLLNEMQNNALATIEQSFNPYINFKKYQDVFNELNLENTNPLHHNTSKKIGSRLDSKFIPNWVTTALRKI